MKKLLLIFLLIPGLALGQSLCRNDAQTTQYATEGQCGQMVAGDQYGNQYVVQVGGGGSGLSQSVVPASRSIGANGTLSIPVAYNYWNALSDTIEANSTVNTLNLTSHVANIGDLIIYRGSGANLDMEIQVCDKTTDTVTLCSPLLATPGLDTIAIVKPFFLAGVRNSTLGTNGQQSLSVNLDYNTQYQASSGPLKLEDSAHVSGDAGVIGFGVQNPSGGITFGSNGDYIPMGLNQYGSVVVDLQANVQGNGTFGNSPIRYEDGAFADQNAVMVGGAVALSSVSQSVSNSGDVAPLALDLASRLIMTKAPLGSQVLGCSSAITTNTTGQIIAAVASNYTFITSWDCTNTGATASRVILEDGDGNDLANQFLVATNGTFNQPFPDIPARTQAVNKAIQVNVITSGSSTICCARGFIGVL